MFNLQNKTALITGASGSIGSAITQILDKQGAQTIISGTNKENLESLASKLTNKTTIEICNLESTEETKNLIKKLGDNKQEPDILICNAGATEDSLSLRMTIEQWEKILKINLTSCFVLNQGIARFMLRKKWGRIINISSIVGLHGNIGQANYAASKAGIIGMSKSLAQEFALKNITINCIAPGLITSKMSNKIPAEHKQKMIDKIPLKYIGDPEDIAYGVAYLASQEARYITGQILNISGGFSM